MQDMNALVKKLCYFDSIIVYTRRFHTDAAVGESKKRRYSYESNEVIQKNLYSIKILTT